MAISFEAAVRVVDELVLAKTGKHLSEPELVVMQGAWHDSDYEEIAGNSPYSLNYLQRTIAPQLWDTLSEVLGNGTCRVGKKKLRYFLEQVAQKYYARSISEEKLSPPARSLLQVIGGQPPDVSSFSGRSPELAMLREALAEERCVALIGPAGIGKSALAAKLIEVLCAPPQPRFDCLVWKSVHYAPLLPDLVTDLLRLLNPSAALNLLESTQTKVSELIAHLQSCRCLVVLDAAEAVLQGNRNTSNNPYGERFAEYGMFFRRVVEEQHRSCLLLTSREPLIDLTRLQRKGQPARTVKLEGLGKEARQILQAKGLTDETEWGNLIETYRGNPLALQIVASRIQDFFGGRVAEFFHCKTTLLGDPFQENLDELFGPNGKLTYLEKQIMFNLAAELGKGVDSIGFSQLVSELKVEKQLRVSTSEVIEALEALSERSLIERNKSATGEVTFTLQPVVKKYMLKYALAAGQEDGLQTVKSA